MKAFRESWRNVTSQNVRLRRVESGPRARVTMLEEERSNTRLGYKICWICCAAGCPSELVGFVGRGRIRRISELRPVVSVQIGDRGGFGLGCAGGESKP